MITVVTGALGTAWGLINASWITRGIAGLVVVLGAWKVNNIIVGKKAVARHVEKSVKTGERINARNVKNRNTALSTPGSASRLECRDCD